MRISDWSSDVCSSDLKSLRLIGANREPEALDPQLFEREFQSRIGCRKRTNIVGIVFQEYGNGSCDQFLRRISVKRQSCIQQRARAVELGRASCRERVCQYV